MKPNRLAILTLTLGATLLTTTTHAQIAITGGELIYFLPQNSPYPTYDNAPVAGYLNTAQGRIQSGNFTHAQAVANPALFEGISLANTPVVLQMNGSQPYNGSSFNLKATGTAYTPNGPVLFSNVPVTLQGSLTTDVTIPLRNFTTPFGIFTNSRYVERWNVTSGTFGTGSSITDNSGNPVSLAVNNFHFDSTHVFPAPPTTPTNPTNPTTTSTTSTPIFNLEPNTTSITTTTFTTEDWEERTTLAPTPTPNLRRNGIVSRIFPTLSLYQ